MCRIYVEKFDVSNGRKGAYFLRKSKNGFVISDQRLLHWLLQNPKTWQRKQTNPELLVLEKFFNENATRKKKTFIALDKKKWRKNMRAKVQIYYGGSFCSLETCILLECGYFGFMIQKTRKIRFWIQESNFPKKNAP